MDLSLFPSINSFMQKLINKKMGYSGLGLLLKRVLHFSFRKTDNPNEKSIAFFLFFKNQALFFSPKFATSLLPGKYFSPTSDSNPQNNPR